MDRNRYPYLGLFIGIMAVSTSAVLVKLSSAPSSVIAAYRLFFTLAIIAIPTFLLHRREFKKLALKEWLYSMLSGTFLAFHFITWFESLKYTSVASSVVLVTLQPIFAMIGVYFLFNEKFSRLGIIGALLSVGGSVIIGWGDFAIGPTALYGDFLALLGAILVTGYWLVGQSLRKKLSLLTYTFLVYGTSTIVLFLYNVLLKIDLFHYSINEWYLFLALALIPTILGHTVFNWTLKYVNATTVSVAILAEPIGASILAYFILKEELFAAQLIGGAIIIVGIFIYLRNK